MNQLTESPLNLKSDELLGKMTIPCIVSKQGSRIVYQLNLKYRQITNLFNHTPLKTKKDEDGSEIDLAVLRNRYVKGEKVEELVQYVTENVDNFILPTISAVTEKMFSFHPYNQQEIMEKLGEEYNVMKKIFVLLSLLVLATSCDWFEFDNQEGWNAQVEGRILDSKTGQPMQFAFPNTSTISIYQEGWDAEKAQTWYVKCNGTYRNKLTWAGDYRMQTVKQNFYPLCR